MCIRDRLLTDRQGGKWFIGVSNGARVNGPSADAHVAQLVEHILGKDEVTSSILVMGSIFSKEFVRKVSNEPTNKRKSNGKRRVPT